MAEPTGVIPPAVDDYLGRTYTFDDDTLQIIAYDPDKGWLLTSPTFRATWVADDALTMMLELGVLV